MPRARTTMTAIILLGACALPWFAGGCESKPAIPTAVTHGRVTLDGQPLPFGEVSFFPDSTKGNAGPMGIGAIMEDGKFEISTSGQKGALVGWHKISIMAIDMSKPIKPWIIPGQYGDPDQSGLTVQIKPNQVNEVPLELKSNP